MPGSRTEGAPRQRGARRSRRIRLVVPRYGPEVSGGSERLARRLAHGLQRRRWEVEVWTTTAGDEATWSAAFPTGDDLDGEVRLRRFPVLGRRSPGLFHQLSRGVFRLPSALRPETAWLLAQGPFAPSLVRALATGDDLPTLFLPYLYHPTLWGLPAAPHPRLLIPAAHDEPALRLRAVGRAVAASDAIWYLTEEERALLETVHPLASQRPHAVGAGAEGWAATCSTRGGPPVAREWICSWRASRSSTPTSPSSRWCSSATPPGRREERQAWSPWGGSTRPSAGPRWLGPRRWWCPARWRASPWWRSRPGRWGARASSTAIRPCWPGRRDGAEEPSSCTTRRSWPRPRSGSSPILAKLGGWAMPGGGMSRCTTGGEEWSDGSRYCSPPRQRRARPGARDRGDAGAHRRPAAPGRLGEPGHRDLPQGAVGGIL